MKKLLIALCFMLGFAGIASAQQAAKKMPATKMAAVKKAPEAKVVKMEKAKPTMDATAPKKADGTLDKRYKANKGQKAPAAGPMKKDGTADMRYKANKKKG